VIAALAAIALSVTGAKEIVAIDAEVIAGAEEQPPIAVERLREVITTVLAYFPSVQVGDGGERRVQIVVNDVLSPAIANIELVRAKTKAVEASRLIELDRTGDVGAAIAAELKRLLIAQGMEIGGIVLLDVAPDDAAIGVVGRSDVDPLARQLLLPAGIYEVSATRDGYERAVASITVTRGETRTLSLRLAEESVLSSPWLYVAIGAAAVAATAAIAVGISSGSEQLPVCHAARRELCD
jgi:hypothetical protein